MSEFQVIPDVVLSEKYFVNMAMIINGCKAVGREY
jgi:hypothetical protein